jgi:hypothetical protein
MRETSDELKAALKAVIEEVGSMRALGRLIVPRKWRSSFANLIPTMRTNAQWLGRR